MAGFWQFVDKHFTPRKPRKISLKQKEERIRRLRLYDLGLWLPFVLFFLSVTSEAFGWIFMGHLFSFGIYFALCGFVVLYFQLIYLAIKRRELLWLSFGLLSGIGAIILVIFMIVPFAFSYYAFVIREAIMDGEEKKTPK